MTKNPKHNSDEALLRKKYLDYLKHKLKLLENNIKEIKTVKTQNISDLTRIKSLLYPLTDKRGIEPFGNNYYLFEENNEILIKKIPNLVDTNKKFETQYGPMITENNGEWGGSLYSVTKYGAKAIACGNFDYVFEYGDKVYGLTTSSHLGINKCSLHQIKKYNDELEDNIIFKSSELSFEGYYVENNYFYFYSNDYNNDGLYKFNLDTNKLKLIKKHLMEYVRVNSLLKKDNYIYIYGNYNLITYDLKTEKTEIFTNLEPKNISKLYLNESKLIDLWDELIIK